MNQESPEQKKAKKYSSGKEFTLKLDFELHDFSNELSFDQIMDTLFIVGKYLNNEDHSIFNKKDIPAIEEWLTRNDLNKFFRAKQVALQAQFKADCEKEAVKEIMNMPLSRKESWH